MNRAEYIKLKSDELYARALDMGYSKSTIIEHLASLKMYAEDEFGHQGDDARMWAIERYNDELDAEQLPIQTEDNNANLPLTLEKFTNDAKKMMEESKRPITVYAAVGTLLENASDYWMMEFLKEQCNAGMSVRAYMFEQIVCAVANKLRYDSKAGN